MACRGEFHRVYYFFHLKKRAEMDILGINNAMDAFVERQKQGL
jgi:hypothetical protein